jgi:hypothetical protein
VAGRRGRVTFYLDSALEDTRGREPLRRSGETDRGGNILKIKGFGRLILNCEEAGSVIASPEKT